MKQEDWIRLLIGLFGGAGGALLTWFTGIRKGRIQPISKKLTVSYIDLPRILIDYSASISLKGSTEDSETYNFKKIALMQLDLVNVGNKDWEELKIGIDLPNENQIIGFQYLSDDRKHTIIYAPEIAITNPQSRIDLTLIPFNRRDKYTVTLVVNSVDNNLFDKIQLSKVAPIKFVEADSVMDTKEFGPWFGAAAIVIFISFSMAFSFFVDHPIIFYGLSFGLLALVGLYLANEFWKDHKRVKTG